MTLCESNPFLMSTYKKKGDAMKSQPMAYVIDLQERLDFLAEYVFYYCMYVFMLTQSKKPSKDYIYFVTILANLREI